MPPPSNAASRRSLTVRLGQCVTLAIALLLGSLASTGPAHATVTSTLSVTPGKSSWIADSPIFRDGFGRLSFVVPPVAARPLLGSVHFRGSSSADGYRTSAYIAQDGSVTLEVSRMNGGAEKRLVTMPLGKQAVAGKRVNLQGWVDGDSSVVVRTRYWVDSATKPGWQLTYTDSSSARVTSRGLVRGRAYLASAATAGAAISVTLTANAESAGSAPSPTTTPTTTTRAKLTDAQVGVPAGTTLTKHVGDLVITKAGAVVSNMDVHGFVIVRAPNVRITRSIIRGGAEPPYHLGLITSVGQSGLVVEDVDLKQERPSVRVDGILGDNFTLRRVHIRGGVDSVKIQGDNVRVENSLLEGLNYFARDPSQNNGPTHNDNVQILRGNNVVITGTTALATTNFAILGAAEWGPVGNLKITNNYVDGGHCTVKLAVRNGHALSATVTGNVFGPHRVVQSCPLVAEKAVRLTQSNNVLEIGGKLVTALRI